MLFSPFCSSAKHYPGGWQEWSQKKKRHVGWLAWAVELTGLLEQLDCSDLCHLKEKLPGAKTRGKEWRMLRTISKWIKNQSFSFSVVLFLWRLHCVLQWRCETDLWPILNLHLRKNRKKSHRQCRRLYVWSQRSFVYSLYFPKVSASVLFTLPRNRNGLTKNASPEIWIASQGSFFEIFCLRLSHWRIWPRYTKQVYADTA